MTPCQLPYPEKFEQALIYFREGHGAKILTDETKLILYGLSQQVLLGPCTEKKPWAWNPVELAKWQAWSHLDKMDKMEAMRLFVKTLEEEEPNWYGHQKSSAVPPPSPRTVSETPTLSSMPADGMWKTPWVTAEKHPHPRYEHSACVLGNCMYVLGGNCGGRYMADVWQLKLDSLTWTCVTSSFKSVVSDDDMEAAAQLPPCAGAVCIPHRGRILMIGGHTKDKNAKAPIGVRVLDPQRSAWSILACDGDVPTARGGHAACLIGDKVYIVGGEDPQRVLISGVHVLDLTTNTWSPLVVETSSKSPTPRAALVCAAYQNRYMIVFGGGSAAHCHNDLWVLDTATNTWDRPAVTGRLPLARAGCAAALLGNIFYIVGGGNNVKGCPDMWTLDLTGLGMEPLQWELACEFDRHNALATEGASLCSCSAYGALVAFGGYNGTYHNAVSICKPELQQTNGKTAPQMYDYEGLAGPLASTNNPEIIPASPRGGVVGDAQLENGRSSEKQAQQAATSAMEEAMAMKDAVNQELSLMRHQLSSAQAMKEAAEQEARDALAELGAEKEEGMRLKDRIFKLEVELAEANEKLQGVGELQAEVAKYKTILKEKEKGGSGLWGFISGA